MSYLEDIAECTAHVYEEKYCPKKPKKDKNFMKKFLAKIDKKINETWDSFGFYVFSTGKKVKKHDNSKGKIHK